MAAACQPQMIVLLLLLVMLMHVQAVAVTTSRTASSMSIEGGDTWYIIASFPRLRQVNYMRLPDTTWRPLLPSDALLAPQAICIDRENRRLFVADPSAAAVYWYQLKVLSDKRLITDGWRRLASSSIAAFGLAIDSVGSLYISGRSRGMVPIDGIFKQDAAILATGTSAAPRSLLTRANTALGPNGTNPQLFEPSGLAVDSFNVYWANTARERHASSVMQASISDDPVFMSPQATVQSSSQAPGSTIHVSLRLLSDSVDSITSVALTEAGILYSARGGVYGVSLSKGDQGCGEERSRCPLVAAVDDPTSVLWDGDGTVYVADRGGGRICSFASGTLAQHPLEGVAEAQGIHGIALLHEAAKSAVSSLSTVRANTWRLLLSIFIALQA
mmetsp:Transcript_23668/g.74410  ORF Transcript_23668/g.74410 Transcript_23668/m.74410 type:complete len:387 (-) Transcript_23668:184-1344(-)